MDLILHLILKAILSTSLKTVTNHPPIRIYVNKIENRITFKIKRGYYLGFLMPETMKLLGNSKNKVSKDKNSKKLGY